MLRSASIRILAGLVTGLVLGAVLAGTQAGAVLGSAAGPTGKLWLDGLTMTVVPLVFALLVTGIMDAAEQAAGGRVAAISLILFVVCLVGSVLISAVLTPLVLEWSPLPAAALQLPGAAVAAGPQVPPTGDWLANIIPVNPIKSAAETAMVPLVIFALLFGGAASRIEPDLSAALKRVFRGIAQTMLVIVHWVLWIAPLGVLALGYGVGATLGGQVAGVLAHYVMVVALACLATIAAAYVATALFGGAGIGRFARAALPSQLIAFSTQSSLASLPAMIDTSRALGVQQGVAGVTLPLAVSLFRAASAAANVAVAVYLAHVHAIPLGPGTLVIGALVAAAASVAAVGLPAQVSFFAIIAPVCLAMNVPVALLPLLLAIETIPDLFRTVGNVTADLAVTRLVAARTGSNADAAEA